MYVIIKLESLEEMFKNYSDSVTQNWIWISEALKYLPILAAVYIVGGQRWTEVQFFSMSFRVE